VLDWRKLEGEKTKSELHSSEDICLKTLHKVGVKRYKCTIPTVSMEEKNILIF